MFTITTNDIDQARRQISLFGGEVDKKAKRAVKRALTGAKRDSIRLTKQMYTLPSRYLQKSMRIRQSGLEGEIKFVGKKNPLHRFKNSPKGRITRRGVYIKTEAERGNLETWQRGFRKNASPVIFEREGKKRYPIRGLKGPSTPEMVEKFAAPIQRNIKAKLMEAFR